MAKGRTILQSQVKLLWGLSAGRCAFENNCRQPCVADATASDRAQPLGEMAHIVGHSDDGPRGDASYPADQREMYDNLILLCPTHHSLVDKQSNSFTVGDLRRWKAEHEAWVQTQLVQELPKVGFVELEMVVNALFSTPAAPNESFSVTPPAAKLAKNRLTDRVRPFLQMGLAVAPEVERFVDHVTALQDDFAERVRSGFVNQYDALRNEGMAGDELFTALLAFATGGSTEMRRQAAGLAVLAYFFVKCEVFEP